MAPGVGVELALVTPLFVDFDGHAGHEDQEREPRADQKDDLRHRRTMSR